MRLIVMIAAVALYACSSGTTSRADCDPIADEISAQARRRGYVVGGDSTPDATAVCESASTNPAAQKDFGKACAALRACNAGE